MKTLLPLLSLISFGIWATPFNLKNGDPLVFATEAIELSDRQSDGTILVSSGGDDLHLEFTAGFGLSTTSRYIRINIENGYFGASLAASGIKTNVNYTSILSQGGGVDDSHAIVEVFAATAQDQSTVFTVESTAFKVIDLSKPVVVTYALYGSPGEAVNQGAALASEQAEFMNFESGIATNYTQGFTMSVGFSSDFLRFNPTFRATETFALGDSDGNLASLAKFRSDFFILKNARRASDAALITDFRDVLKGVTTSLKNAYVQGDFMIGEASLNANDDCSGASTALVPEGQSNQVLISLDTLFNFPVLCIDLTNNNIPVSRAEYQLDLGLGGASDFFGRIRYDGSSADLPYITTFSEYRQKIILTNHTGFEIKYKFLFIPELGDDSSYTSLPASEGVIPAGSALKLDSTDIVEISDGVSTRISARLFFDALPEDISAAIQIVGLNSDAPPVTNILNLISN